MGNEIIIPGTPLADIPPQDRPVFDPRLQNGYLTGSLTSPPPGTSVEHYVLGGSASLGGLLAPNDYNFTKSASLNANTFISLLAFLGPIFGTSPGGGLYTLVFQALGTPTTTDVFLTNNSVPSPTKDIDLTAAKTLIIPRAQLAGLGIFNSDTVAQTIGVAGYFDPATAEFNYYSFTVAMPAGVLLNPADVIRIRYVTAGFNLTGSDTGAEMPDEIDLSYYLGTPPSLTAFPAARFGLRGAKLSRFQSYAKIAGGITPGRLYSLEGTRDILGTDFNLAGASYAPVFEIGAWIKFMPGANSLSPSFSLQVDIYRGANQ